MPSTAALAFSLFQQAAFLSFAVVSLSALSNQLTPRPRLRRVALGAIFGFVGSLTMIQVVALGPGYILDVRIAAMALYADRVPQFTALLAAENGDLPRFYSRVKALAALPAAEREPALMAASRH